MSTDTKSTDNLNGQHDDGLWPDFERSAESSVHPALDDHAASLTKSEDNLWPDETLSGESVEDDTRVEDATHREKIDGLYPDEKLSVESVSDGRSGSEEASSTASESKDGADAPDGDSEAPKAADKPADKPAPKPAAKKTAAAGS